MRHRHCASSPAWLHRALPLSKVAWPRSSRSSRGWPTKPMPTRRGAWPPTVIGARWCTTCGSRWSSWRARSTMETGAGVGACRLVAGKSGGQRQKLASTCLVAAPGCQLSGDDQAVPNFATVVLDEGFDKEAADLARTAMNALWVADPERAAELVGQGERWRRAASAAQCPGPGMAADPPGRNFGVHPCVPRTLGRRGRRRPIARFE
jgi:hypothetical protein